MTTSTELVEFERLILLDELKAKLAKQKSDPESTEKEILATENEITYLESIHENFYIGMNVFRTAKGGRDKISA